MSLLLRYMLSFCHKCGAVENRFNTYLKNYGEDSYIICYKCPKCGFDNEVVASKDDLKSLYSTDEKTYG